MKIVVFGPERRVGALVGERVIDLNRGMARQLQEQRRIKSGRASGDTSAGAPLDIHRVRPAGFGECPAGHRPIRQERAR